MRKTKLRHKSKNPIRALRGKADRALQNFFRRAYPNRKCESCGIRTFYCMHHFIEKSRSANLRFNHLNLVFICKSCHSSHHSFGDASIHARIQSRKGDEWWQELQKESKKIISPFSKKELEEFIKIYDQ